MEIADRFRVFIDEQNLFAPSDRVLLGVSGGRDSMLMLWLFQTQKFDVEVAHCNFNLRGDESDGDERFVQAYCAAHNIPFHVRHFDTKQLATDQKISIQMAARELRYQWFDELANVRNCSFIAIAHHKNDHVETVLLNMTRGTGLAGLQGIQPKRQRIIRPLLFLDAQEVAATVQQYRIPYRDDSSNFSNKYARNKIRLDILPQFEQLSPDFVDIMVDNIERFRDAYQVLQQLVMERRAQMLQADGHGRWYMEKDLLRNTDLPLLYYLFEPYGFSKSILQDVLTVIDHEPGRTFESSTHQILLDRKTLILQEIAPRAIAPTYISEEDVRAAWSDYQFKLDTQESTAILRDPYTAQLDYALLKFPLQIRSWQMGDYFQPLGMRGRKKMSDFFVQQKINVFDKKNTPIVVNGNGDILWVAGHRIDDRYKITENTQKVLTLVCQKQGT